MIRYSYNGNYHRRLPFSCHASLCRIGRSRAGEYPYLTPVMVEAIAHAEEPFVLLGRDVLNLVLDGPQLALEIG
jgi:hypothetical protein